jgi:hypothetical protein
MNVTEYRALAAAAYAEDQFQAEVVERAQAYHWWWFHDNDSRRNNGGLPDLILVRPPRLIFAELKREQGKVRRAQRRLLELLWRVPGVETYVWRPSDLLSGEIDRRLS